ncbi:MAG: FAD-dependent oxidoreductase [Nitrospirae bacterium]|nr:FAD-dependent oxidoreductase [Nitrospirota bacterium]
MPSTVRYDAIVVGGGLAGVAVATLLAKRGRRVVLVEPRPDWGGRTPVQRVNGVSISSGATLAAGYERMGRVDAYFESIGMSLELLIRESSVMKREPVQTLWGDHRVTMGSSRADVLEELRREYRMTSADGEAMLADVESSRSLLDPLFDPPLSKSADSPWLRLRRGPAPDHSSRGSVAFRSETTHRPAGGRTPLAIISLRGKDS